MARLCMVVVSLLLVGVTSGCVTSDTLIKLNRDGSGIVIQKTLMSSEMVSQLAYMMQEIGKQVTGNEPAERQAKEPEFFSEKDARARAAKMGVGVRFVSSRKIASAGMEGQEATYTFRDVTQLRLSQKPEAPSIDGPQPNSAATASEATFRFSKLPNGHSRLAAVLASPGSRSQRTTPKDLEVTPSGALKSPTAEQLEQAKKLFAGLRISMAVEVQGRIVKTNSVYQEGAKVTLLEMDFSELLSNDAMLQQVAAIKGQNLEEAKELLKGLRGFKINLDPEIQIEFSE